MQRLALALDAGLPLPAVGRIAVFRPGRDDDLSSLPQDRVHVVQGFRPDHDHFVLQGYHCSPEPEGTYAAAIVVVPRAKAEARALVAEASRLSGGGVIVVDGQKTNGVDGLLREIRQKAAVETVLSKAHGKLFWFHGGDFGNWREAGVPKSLPGGFRTRAGVFSADGPDPASVALAAGLPGRLPGRVADLGAGWGYLSLAVLGRAGPEEVHLVEAEHAALDCARLNVTDPRARFHWADATRFHAEPFDMVVMNPPFHTGRAADPAIGREFISSAARLLKPQGHLWLVANRHLPYEKHLAEVFGEVEEADGTPQFKILHAMRARHGRR